MTDSADNQPRGTALDIHRVAENLMHEGDMASARHDNADAAIDYAMAAVHEFVCLQMIPDSRPRTRQIIEESYKNLLLRSYECGTR